MSNQEEVKKLSEQLNSQKLLKFFKETTKLKTKEITYLPLFPHYSLVLLEEIVGVEETSS